MLNPLAKYSVKESADPASRVYRFTRGLRYLLRGSGVIIGHDRTHMLLAFT